jgi:hypothetical protein
MAYRAPGNTSLIRLKFRKAQNPFAFVERMDSLYGCPGLEFKAIRRYRRLGKLGKASKYVVRIFRVVTVSRDRLD